MREPVGEGPPPDESSRRRYQAAMYVFGIGLGLIGVARLVEGGQSTLGFWSSVVLVAVGGLAALVLVYAALTGRVP
jgi:hypothetical protein